MIILHWQSPSPPTKRVVILFGIGLIGRAILGALVSRFDPKITTLPFTWVAPFQVQQIEAKKIMAAIVAACEPHLTDCQVDIVWSAGRAGFGASPDAFEGESQSFAAVASMCRLLTKSRPGHRQVMLHLLSSAGGLFEGQRHVGLHDEPRPLRPYGHAKLAQEHTVQAMEADVPYVIYRPSSVYGYGGTKGRIGLIVALIDAALRNGTAVIFGHQETLRDFVFVGDIGRFIADRISDRPRGSQVYLLASGRPTSMYEVISLVERVMGCRLAVRFNRGSDNVLHNSYRPSALVSQWFPMDLETGVATIAEQMRMRYFHKVDLF